MSRSIDKNELANYFPGAYSIFHTTGTKEGVILKFDTFYLKIYDDDECEDSYRIEIYKYGCQGPIVFTSVPYNRMREYASRFRKTAILNY